MHLELKDQDNQYQLIVRRDGGDWTVQNGGQSLGYSVASARAGEVELERDGRRVRAYVAAADGRRLVFIHGRVHEFSLVDDQHADTDEAGGPVGPNLVAEMPGTVVKVMVQTGDQVAVGTPLLIVEAMKMETEINATVSGKVTSVHVKAGDVVKQQAPLIDLEPDGE
jgi:3-methylcrotonyl-CoA carboxylase alpha subunit